MKLLVLITIIAIGLIQNPVKETGLEIFQVKKTYPDFTKKEKPDCYYCLELTSEDLFKNPLLTENDIKEFDWGTQQIILTDSAKQRINSLTIPLQGLPVAMVLNGEIIYGFWFWNKVSSFGCDWIYTFPTIDFKIKFWLPSSNRYGNDPRFDERLRKHLKKMNKN